MQPPTLRQKIDRYQSITKKIKGISLLPVILCRVPIIIPRKTPSRLEQPLTVQESVENRHVCELGKSMNYRRSAQWQSTSWSVRRKTSSPMITQVFLSRQIQNNLDRVKTRQKNTRIQARNSRESSTCQMFSWQQYELLANFIPLQKITKTNAHCSSSTVEVVVVAISQPKIPSRTQI